MEYLAVNIYFENFAGTSFKKKPPPSSYFMFMHMFK